LADITLSGRLFQMVGPATGKARPPTVDSFNGWHRQTIGLSRAEGTLTRQIGDTYSLLSPEPMEADECVEDVV